MEKCHSIQLDLIMEQVLQICLSLMTQRLNSYFRKQMQEEDRPLNLLTGLEILMKHFKVSLEMMNSTQLKSLILLFD